jgi:hypothetical protein
VQIEETSKSQICQGDIYRGIIYHEYAIETDDIIEISQIVFPAAVVLTQECDLFQDYTYRSGGERHTNDKLLLSVLMAPVYNFDHFIKGQHLSELGLTMEKISSDPKRLIVSNQNARYHYLDFPDSARLPSSVIDFKHYFSVTVRNLTDLKDLNFICRVSPLFREDISQRFANFLSRIGLPELCQGKDCGVQPDT